ncbi:MAG: protoporphyrinogen oxidase [Acidimicrobiales bacterium]
MTHVDLVVVGGGITGLAAAWEARQRGAEVLVLEAGDQAGGMLRTSPVAGIPLDESADAFLARVPEAVTLCTELGLATELVSPATGRAYVWVDGSLRCLPEAHLLGVPTDLEAVESTGILSPDGLARAHQDLRRHDAWVPATAGAPPAADPTKARDDQAGATAHRGAAPADESVGALVRRRLGDEVLDRLVAPLVGGIWAGDCDRLSLQAATPALAEARSRAPSLVEGAASVRADALASAARDPGSSEAQQASAASAGGRHDHKRAAPGAPRPVFLAPRGGMAQLVEALRAALGDRLRTGHTVTAIEPMSTTGRGRWCIHVAPSPDRGSTGLDTRHPFATSGQNVAAPDADHTAGTRRTARPTGDTDRAITADGVVVATPAFAAAPLVAPHCPGATATLASIEYASVALVALAVPRGGVDRPLDGSGFLVPPSAGRTLTACSWTSSKWPHLTEGAGAGDLVLLRASAGRDGDDRALALDDAKLVDAVLADLADAMGLRAAPVDVRVSRWLQSFPQPRPGHLDRVATLEVELARDAPGLLVAGAWARGVGIPACIRAGRHATRAALSL